MASSAVDLAQKHALALKRFKVTVQAEDKQRKRELEDLKFADPIEPEDQWPSDALASRAGVPASGTFPAVPPRPALTINKLRQPIQQIQNQQRQARFSLEFSPESNGASIEDAEAFEDIARAVQADSRAHLARNWAFDRAIKCGRGFYRIEAEYLNDRSFDQKLVYKRILNQFSVYFYPFCQEPDYSDAEWCFITEDVPLEEYRRRYPDSDLATADDEELTAWGNEHTDWTGETDEGRTIRIAEYYHFDHRQETLVGIQTPDGPQAVLESDLPPGAKILNGPEGRPLRRPVDVKTLCWAKLNGQEFIKDEGQADFIVERDIDLIPVIPVIADESNINGDRRYTGIVRPALDAQRLFNVEASSLAEAVHLGPLSPFIGYAEQFEGYEAWWAQLNIRRFPYLPVNPAKDGTGAALALPQRNTAEQPIQAITVSLEKAADYIHDTTGVPPVALGNLDPHERSGKAIAALQQQAELGTSGYLDNLSNMSLLLEGKILNSWIPKIYGRPGRIVSMQGDDDERKTVMLGQPFVRDDKDMPVPAQGHEPTATVIDLAKGEYAVAPTIGKSFSTKRQEGMANLTNLAQAAPELVPAFADKWVGYMDGPGFQQIADRLARAVPPQFRDPAQGDTPEALKQQLAAAAQQMQQMQQQFQEVAQIADKNRTDLAKAQISAQAGLQEKQLELASREKVALIQASAQLTATQAKIDAEDARTFVDAMEARLGKLLELHMARLGQVHEAVQQQREQAHDLGMAAVTQQHASEMADKQAQNAAITQGMQQGHEAAMAQQQQAQANQPEAQ